MRSGEFWFFYDAKAFDFEKALAALEAAGHHARRAGKLAHIENDGLVFTARECTEETVQELRAVAASKVDGEKRAAVLACTGAVEIAVDDLDAAQDEINTLIDMQLTLQDASTGFLFIGWNGIVQGPDD